jgi:hypothetical protein
MRPNPYRRAEAGGNLPAIGYLPPGQLTQVGAYVYNRLVAGGVPPTTALQLAKRAQARFEPSTPGFFSDLESFIVGSLSGFAQDVAKGNFSPGAIAAGIFAPSFTTLAPAGLRSGIGPSLGNLVTTTGGELTTGFPVVAAASALARGGQAVAQAQNRRAPQFFGGKPPLPTVQQQGFLPQLIQGVKEIPQAVDFGVKLGNAVGELIPPGPDANGLPTAGLTPQGVPILDATTPCPSCGTGLPAEAAPSNVLEIPQAVPANPLQLQPGSLGPTLPPPPPANDIALTPPDYQGPTSQSPPPGYDYLAQGGNQPSGQGGGGQPSGLPVFQNQPGSENPLSWINRLQGQLNQEIQVEQQQQAQKSHQQQQLNQKLQQIQDQVDYLKNLENQRPELRDIPQELNQKQALQQMLENLKPQAGQIPQVYQPGPQTPMPPLKLRPEPSQIPFQPMQPGRVQHPLTPPGPQKPQPTQFCVGCQSQEDAILFLNGEQAACSVIPGSTGPIEGV